jgi:hypothetical protein
VKTLLDPPAAMPELDGLHETWVEYLGRQFKQEIGYVRRRYDPKGTAGETVPVQFVDPTQTAVPVDARLHAVSWNGFPRKLRIQERDGDVDAFPAAERTRMKRDMFYTVDGEPFEISYRNGDEYLEWRADLDERGRITRITFTCEPPDYWSVVAQGYPSPFFMLPGAQTPKRRRDAGRPDRLLARYHQLVGPDVQLADLVFVQDLFDRPGRPGRRLMFRAGEYNPWNVWNVERGIVHLSHPANTLGEEIELVGDATVLRATASGRPIQAAKCLLCCGGFGDVNRSSDPAIGAAVNELARAGYAVTIANPIGLYMSHLEDTGWTRPDGLPVSPGWWRVERMSAGEPGLAGTARAVRAVYEVPPGETYRDDDGMTRPLVVGDLRIGGAPIRYAGQVADAVRMVLVLAAWPLGGPMPEPVCCEPEYRCCRRRDGGQFLTLLQGPDGDRVKPCDERHVDAFSVVTVSADHRHRRLSEGG